MGYASDAPYTYSPSHNNSTFDFNPRAYSQASYAVSVHSEQRRSRPQQQGPLIDLNRHPDSWMIVAHGSNPNIKPLPSNTKKKIVVTRWVQFASRLLQLVATLGLFVCLVCVNGMQGAWQWILRIPVSA